MHAHEYIQTNIQYTSILRIMCGIYEFSASKLENLQNLTDIHHVRFALDINTPVNKAVHPFGCGKASIRCMKQLQTNRNRYFEHVLGECSKSNQYSSLFLRSILCDIFKEFSLSLTVNSVDLETYRPNKHSWNDAIKFWESLYNNPQLNPPLGQNAEAFVSVNSNSEDMHIHQENISRISDDVIQSLRQIFIDNSTLNM